MMGIAWDESRYQWWAVNPSSGAACWLQVMPMHGYSIEWLVDPHNCVEAGYSLWLARGYQPWGR